MTEDNTSVLTTLKQFLEDFAFEVTEYKGCRAYRIYRDGSTLYFIRNDKLWKVSPTGEEMQKFP